MKAYFLSYVLRHLQQNTSRREFEALKLPAVPEIIDQRLPDALKQRQPRMITRFGAADVQNIAAPIDIFQSQPDYFTGTQAIDRQKLEDSMVAQAHRRPVFSGKFQDGRDLIRT